MDKIFDSMNASIINPEFGKPLRSAIRDTFPHLDYWKYAIKVFESMKFINKKNGRTMTPLSVKYCIFTFNSFIYLWFQLTKYNFKYFLPRHDNQEFLNIYLVKYVVMLLEILIQIVFNSFFCLKHYQLLILYL